MDNSNEVSDLKPNTLRTIAVMNSKGGSGKTTITTNLANFYASRDLKTLIVDHDAQGSSSQWQKRRTTDQPTIEITEAYRQPTNYTRSWLMRVPLGTQRVLIDTPAGIDIHQMESIAKRADIVLIPVLPSPIDIEAVGQFIQRLSKSTWIKTGQTRLAVVANRVRYQTRVYDKLENYLRSLDIPFITSLRDTQNYIHASELGTGIHNLTKNNAQRDMQQWQELINWIEQKKSDNDNQTMLVNHRMQRPERPGTVPQLFNESGQFH